MNKNNELLLAQGWCYRAQCVIGDATKHLQFNYTVSPKMSLFCITVTLKYVNRL